MDVLMARIRDRLDAVLGALADGGDLAPGERYRLEGLCEAAVLTGVASPADIKALLRGRYKETTGRELDGDLWAGWEALHPFPSLPLYMARAPVSISTSD